PLLVYARLTALARVATACPTAPARIAARSPCRCTRVCAVPPGPATPTYTVPTGWPSCASGPATPVVDTPYVASRRSRAPAAICSATTGSTAPHQIGRAHV